MTVKQAQNAALAELQRADVSVGDVKAATGKNFSDLFTAKKVDDKVVDDDKKVVDDDKKVVDDDKKVVDDDDKVVIGDLVCGPGYKKSIDGKTCVPDTTIVTEETSCPTGQHRDAATGKCVPNISATQNTTTNVTTPTNISTADKSTLPVGVSGAGITTINPNGTVTTRPDLSLGMSTVRDDYVKGGGNLGYTSPTFASLKAVEDKYPLTGGSKQSYDYLTGKTNYSPVPYTETGEIMKPYSSSVLGIPTASAKQMYVFKNGKYEINPDYAIPTYDKDGKKSLAVTNQDVINYVKSPEYSNDDAFISWMTANNLTPEQIAAATGMPISEVYKKIKKAKPVEKV